MEAIYFWKGQNGHPEESNTEKLDQESALIVVAVIVIVVSVVLFWESGRRMCDGLTGVVGVARLPSLETPFWESIQNAVKRERKGWPLGGRRPKNASAMTSRGFLCERLGGGVIFAICHFQYDYATIMCFHTRRRFFSYTHMYTVATRRGNVFACCGRQRCKK